MAAEITDDDAEKTIANDTTQMAVPQNSVNEFEATYTFEVQSDVNTNRTDRLPSNSLHVLEEISADENIGLAVRGNVQATAADCEQDAPQTQHIANNNTDDAELLEAKKTQPLQATTVQHQEAHTSKNIQNDGAESCYLLLHPPIFPSRDKKRCHRRMFVLQRVSWHLRDQPPPWLPGQSFLRDHFAHTYSSLAEESFQR